MRVLLINPPIPFAPREVLDAPLGLAYIGAMLERASHQVYALDLAIVDGPLNHLRQTVFEVKPDVVGVTSVACTFNSAMEIVRLCRIQNSSIVTVLGGVHVTLMRNRLDSYLDEAVDFVVFDEGEITMSELVETLEAGDSPRHVAGIGYFMEGEFIQTTRRDPISDLDSLPLPARHLFPMDAYMQTHVMSSRGCPYQCLFCSSRDFWQGRVRFRSPDNSVMEIESILREYGDRKIFLADDTFTLDQQRTKAICELIQRRRLEFRWSCLTRVDCVSLELLQAMAQSGCETISFGCEIGSQDELDQLNKGITIDQIKRAIRLTKQAGIAARTSWIFGFPWSREESLRETIELIKEVAPEEVVIYTPVPYPGTNLYNSMGRYGIELMTQNESEFYSGTQTPLVTSQSLPAELVEEIMRLAVRELRSMGYREPTDAQEGNKVVATSFSAIRSFQRCGARPHC